MKDSTVSGATATDAEEAWRLSPYTGWTRDRWTEFGDRLLMARTGYASPGHGRITFPGPEGGYGRDVDGLEGFARTFLLAGFRLAGERGADPLNLAEWYAQGIATGTDPYAADRWVRLTEHPQAKVEAASIALILDMTRPWIWDRLSARVQEQVVDYLAPAVGDGTYPAINWVWFRLVVQTFLRSVGGPHSVSEMAEDLATHDSFARVDGWLADGPERSFDHYVGWALQLYPTLWARMAGAEDLAAPRCAKDLARLDRFLTDAVALVGANGSPLLQGRSLIYRFATAAPYWVGALAGVPSTRPGLLRRAASGILRYFSDHGVPDQRGVLTLGWFDEWRPLPQAYSGPSSPYWAAKGMLGLCLPADHPAWTAVEEPLPVEREDFLARIAAPGWIVSGTRSDGIVRVINHGTDHAREGEMPGDSPLYARLGYSTATGPLLDAASWRDPCDGSVTLVDAGGRATHRTGMRVITVQVQEGSGSSVGVGASIAAAHWLDPDADQLHHGHGWIGAARFAGEIVVVSVVRGPWELRLARVASLADGLRPAELRLRFTGWALAGREPRPVGTSAAAVDGTVSALVAVLGEPTAGVSRHDDASSLGAVALVPTLDFPVEPGSWVAALVTLSAAPDAVDRGKTCTTRVVADGPGWTVNVTWPDGVRTKAVLVLETPGDASPATR